MKEMLLFVYGTLRSGQRNHTVLNGARCVGPARTVSRMALRSSGPNGIPFACTDQAISTLTGELYVVDAQLLAEIDRFEGYRPQDRTQRGGYERREVAVLTDHDGEERLHFAQMYCCPTVDYPLVPSGRPEDARHEAPDDVWYFAYGSNMWVDQMHHRRIAYTRREPAVLHGYVREFTKRASDPKLGAYATVRPLAGSEVPGALYRFPASDLALLDRAEGAPVHYVRTSVVVVRADGSSLEAITYIAHPDQVVRGLHVDGNYLAKITSGGADLWGLGHERRGTVLPAAPVNYPPRAAEGWNDGSWDAPRLDPSDRPLRMPMTSEEFESCDNGEDWWSGVYPVREIDAGWPCVWKVWVDGIRARMYLVQLSSTRIGLCFESPHPCLGLHYCTKYYNFHGPGKLALRLNYDDPRIPNIWQAQGKVWVEWGGG